MKLCWADRIGVGWAVIVYALFGLLGAFTAGVPDPAHNFQQVSLIFVLPVWAFFRFLDFVGGGPSRRRGQFRVTVHR